MALSIKVGTYTGTGSALSVTGVGFQPTVLLIKGGANIAQIATANQGSDKMQDITGATPATGRLTSFDADGFTLGTNAKVNTNGTVYHYVAFLDADATEMDRGTYAGTGSAQNITTAFQPDAVWIFDDLGDTGGWRTSTMATDSYSPYGAGAFLTDRILSLGATNFRVSFRNEVNGTGRNYYWVAFKTTTNKVKPLSYTGNGSDDRAITGVGFQPDFTMVKDAAANAMAVRFSTETGDNSYLMTASGEAANIIQSQDADGFTVGTAANVNTNTNTYHSLSFKSTSTTTATPNKLTLLGVG